MLKVFKRIFAAKKMREEQLALGKYVWFNRQDKIKRLTVLNEALEMDLREAKDSLRREIELNAKLMAKGTNK